MTLLGGDIDWIVSSTQLFGRDLWIMSGPSATIEDRLGVHYPMSFGDCDPYTTQILTFTHIASVAPRVRAPLSRHMQYVSVAGLFHNVVAIFDRLF